MFYRAPTMGTRVAVWAFPALTAYLGVGYVFFDRIHYQSTAFNGAKEVMPLREWGVIFLVVAAAKVIALVWDKFTMFVMAMCAGIGLYLVWSALFVWAYFMDYHTSPGAPAWPMFVVLMHFAVLETLTNGAMAQALKKPLNRKR